MELNSVSLDVSTQTQHFVVQHGVEQQGGDRTITFVSATFSRAAAVAVPAASTDRFEDVLLEFHPPGLFDSVFSDSGGHMPCAPEPGYTFARVTISNRGEEEVRLHRLSPALIATQQGVYDVNARLLKSSIAVGPRASYHFWMTPQSDSSVPDESSSATAQSPIAHESGKLFSSCLPLHLVGMPSEPGLLA